MVSMGCIGSESIDMDRSGEAEVGTSEILLSSEGKWRSILTIDSSAKRM